jgi:hypothetical protein
VDGVQEEWKICAAGFSWAWDPFGLLLWMGPVSASVSVAWVVEQVTF